MTLLWACAGWALASAAVAMLPMRLQYVPGVLLLLAAPGLILWIALAVGWWAGVLACLAFLSTFRNPLRYFWTRASGRDGAAKK
jgi:hypothetical protein